MKRLTRDVKRIEVYYEAIDGKTFNNEEDCKKYEASTKCVFKTLLKEKSVSKKEYCGDGFFPCWDSETMLMSFKPKNATEAAEIINAYKMCNFGNTDDLTPMLNADGKKTYIIETQWGDDVYLYDLEELKKDICSDLDALFNPKPEEKASDEK